jgi:4-nitrophenyl phosphatase
MHAVVGMGEQDHAPATTIHLDATAEATTATPAKQRAAKLAFLNTFDTLLLDCDGVIWHGANLIPGVDRVLSTLRTLGKRILFVSNNSTKSRPAYLEKFQSLGIDHVSHEEIFGSAYAAALYMSRSLAFPADKQVYVVGMGGIREELLAQGIQVADEDGSNLPHINDMHTITPDARVGAVLFGFDLEFNYKKLAKAFTYLHGKPDVHFLATNSDRTFPAANGTVYPGTGALLASLSHALQREPVVIGKPHQPMLDAIVDAGHLDRGRTLMVGDRLDTDIAFGKHGGLRTLLVLTGVTKATDLHGLPADQQPDYVLSSLGALFDGLDSFAPGSAQAAN